MKLLLLLISSIFCSALSLLQIMATHGALSREQANAYEVLYLPSGKALQFSSFGFRVFLSDLLWFNTINYFGKHYAGDRNYRWLSHMCDLVTTLDPRKEFAYDFCSTIISWEAGLPADSLRLLSRAIDNFPANWRFYYLRGFTHMYFLKDEEAARRDFTQASRLPDAHPIVARLAAKKMALSGNLEDALTFLSEMLRSSRNQYQQQALEQRYRELRYELDFQNLEKAVNIYTQLTGRAPASLEDLILRGVLKSLPADPFGGSYYLDPETRQVFSTSGHKRIGMQRTAEGAKGL